MKIQANGNATPPVLQDPVTVLGVLYYGKFFCPEMLETTLEKMGNKNLANKSGKKKANESWQTLHPL